MSLWQTKSGLLNLGIIAVVFGILALVRLPDSSYLWQELHNYGHTPLFGILAIALLRICRSYLGDDFLVLLQYLVAGGVALTLGLAWELIQIPTAGDADVTDLARDGAGIVGMLSIWLARDKAYWIRRERKQQKKRVSYFLFGSAVLIISTIPLMVWTAAYIERDNAFPSLSRFDTFLGRKFIRMRDCSYEMSEPPLDWQNLPEHPLPKFRLLSGVEYPAMELADPVPDWQGYATLYFEIYNPADSSISLVVSIEDDGHNRTLEDRYSNWLELLPGLNRIELNLNDIKNAPFDRLMDMSQIARIKLFGKNLAEPIEFYLNDFQLR